MLIWIAVLCVVSGLRAQAPAVQGAPPNPSAEQHVVGVRVVTEEGQVLEEDPAALPTQRGQALSSEAVRESLRQLYRTGRYADVRAEISPAAGGVRLDFIVRQNYFVNVVRIAGLREPPSEPQALASLRLGLGDAFRESNVAEALDRLRQTLVDNGFYQAQLAYDLQPHADTRQMDITVHVKPGPRARLGRVTLLNHTAFPDGDLIRRSKLRSGREISLSRLERGAERLRKFLVKKNHLGARATTHRGEYDAKTNTLPLEVELTAGPRVRAEITGATIRGGELHKFLPIYQEGAVDEDLLQEGRRAIRDYLERQGYSDVQVNFTATEAAARDSSPEQVITYTIERGPRHRVVGISFDGNKYFDNDLLRSRLNILPAEFASWGRFSRRLMDADATSMLTLYIANGFRDAQVRAELLDDYRGKVGNLFIRFHIVEGPQTRVAELKFEGNKALSTEELTGVIGSTAGQPYSEFEVSGDRDNILAIYFNEGFPEARFAATVEELHDSPAGPEASPAPRVRLTYRIEEGSQINVARVLLGGYEHARESLIAREVQVKPGGPLREGEVVESQRRLYNLGIFSRVSIAPQNPTGTDPNKTVVVLVEEAKRYTLGYGFGLEVQRLGGAGGPVNGVLRGSPRGLLELTKNDLTGRADSLSFKVRASTFQGRALVSYATPNAFARPKLSLQITGFADKARDILTFTSTRYEGSAQLAQEVSRVTSLLYRYTFRKVLVDAASLRISPDQIPLFSQPTKVSLFGATWLRERRDNPADATHGSFNTVDVSLAGKPIGSSASFFRGVAQNATFHPFRRRFVFARSLRFGIQEPIGHTLSTEIPLPERFFAGGGTSLRGFGLNQAGPRDPTTGFPVGGQALLVFNQELRFPMRLPYLGTRLGGTLFYDAGNVFTNLSHITVRATPSSPQDLNYFSHTIGFGIRYATPVGPVRVDLGYQLNAAHFCTTGPVGNPAPAGCSTGQTLTRLPRFQFFFNFGSIF